MRFFIASEQIMRAKNHVNQSMTMEQLLEAEQRAAQWIRKARKIPPSSIEKSSQRIYRIITKRMVFTGLAIGPRLWETVGMSEKRTKADKAQRQADQLEKKSSQRPPQNQGKKARVDFSQAAVRMVREAAENH